MAAKTSYEDRSSMKVRKKMNAQSMEDLFPSMASSLSHARPFLKWAGGKTQLLSQLEVRFPKQLIEGRVKNYFEPFLGGGAVYFYAMQKYRIERAFLCDINKELILAYKVVKRDVSALIDALSKLSDRYFKTTINERGDLFNEVREQYNEERTRIDYQTYNTDWVKRATKMIFLNKTCFNGLFRVNKSGEFNVPFGRYENPPILDSVNLTNASAMLQKAEIEIAHFEDIQQKVVENSFVYFDPPYKPISTTSSFTSYSTFSFGDESQLHLAEVFRRLTRKRNVWLMLSNSDPDGGFFQNLYKHKGIYIDKVLASRMINSVAEKRGRIAELVITNYETNKSK
jgi:DNA adenine methylase